MRRLILCSIVLLINNLLFSQAVFSTFLGGETIDDAKVTFIDPLGRVVVGGAVDTGFYTTTNAYDQSFNGGDSDVGIAVFSANGDSILFSSYLGGSDWEEVYGMQIDKDGNLLVSGRTRSKDFPTTAGAFLDTAGIGMNAFVSKINLKTGRLMFSTFLGEGNAHSLNILSNNQIVIGGLTESKNFPVTIGALDTSLNGDLDVFVSIISENGDSLLYSTLLGSEKWDRFAGIDIDNYDNIYVAGFSEGDSFPKATNQTLNSGVGYLVKLKPTLDSIQYCTRVESIIWDIVVDKKMGEAVLLGAESDSKIIYPTGVYRDSSIGRLDVMISRISNTGDFILNGTFFGGYSTDFPLGIDMDNDGRVYIAGRVGGNIPLSNNAISSYHHGVLPGIDAFAAVFSKDLKHLDYSTMIGKWDMDVAWDIKCNNSGEFVVVGETSSEGFQVTSNAFQDTLKGASDFFITKINLFEVNHTLEFNNQITAKVFPNPANDYVTILNAPFDNFEFSLVSTEGKVVLNGNGTNGLPIEFNDVPDGFYNLILLSGDEKHVIKFIIQND